MARDYRHPDIRMRYRSPSRGGVDWVLLESAFWVCEDEGMESCATLLVSCAHGPNICGVLGVPADNGRQTFGKHGRCDFDPGLDWRKACGTSSIIEFAVVYVDECATLSPQAIGELVQSLKGTGATAVVVVCPDFAMRQAILGADGFVVGSVETTIRTAGMLAQLICNVVQAPATGACVDGYELKAALCGTALAPSVLAEAIWRWQPIRVAWLDPADMAAVTSAELVVIDPGLLHTHLADGAELGRYIRTLNPAEGIDVLLGAAFGGFRISCDSPRAALIRLLCRPDTGQTAQTTIME